MKTWTALTTLAGKARAEALGEALEALEPEPTGVGVFEVEDGSEVWEVGGYFTEAPDEIALALLAASFGAAEFAQIGQMIDKVLTGLAANGPDGNGDVEAAVKAEALALCEAFPIYGNK